MKRQKRKLLTINGEVLYMTCSNANATRALKSREQTAVSNSYIKIDYFLVKDDFSKWLKIRGINWEHHAKKMVRYLERFAKPIYKPMHLVLLFEGLGNSRARKCYLHNQFPKILESRREF